MNDISINGDPAYLNYQFDLFTVPVLAASAPIVYLLPTVVIVFRIFRKYMNHLFKKRDERINHHVFTVIVTHIILGFCYMLADYTSFRIPATGLLTTWCASQQPNHGLKVLFFLSVYFNYTAMIFPFLLSVLRLIPIYYPLRLDELCSKIVRVSIPAILVYPFFFSFPLLPALGDCRQLLGTYQFGGTYFYYRGAWFEVKQASAMILNSTFWLSACLIASVILYRKLKKMRIKQKSSKLHKAEMSLTLITISKFPSYITNFAFLIGFLINPVSAAYLMGLRPFGSDCEFVFVSWVFYMTHPIFKVQKVDGIIPSKEDTKTKRNPTIF